MVGRKNFLSRVREAPTGVGLGLCVPGRGEHPSSLWPIHWDLFPFPPEVRCTLSLTFKCCVLPQTYDNIKIHTFVHAFVLISDIFMNILKGLYCIWDRTEQNWFIIPIDYKARVNNMINAWWYMYVFQCSVVCLKPLRGKDRFLAIVYFMFDFYSKWKDEAISRAMTT